MIRIAISDAAQCATEPIDFKMWLGRNASDNHTQLCDLKLMKKNIERRMKNCVKTGNVFKN